MDPLFPELPEDLAGLSDEELADLLRVHEVAAELIDAEDEDFTKGLSADELLSEYERGVEQIEAVRAEQQNRVEQQEAYTAKKTELSERRKVEETEGDGDEGGDGEGDGEGDGAVQSEEEAEPLAAETGDEGDGGDGDGEAVEPEPKTEVLAMERRQQMRRPPSPALDRQAPESGTVLIAAAGQVGVRGGQPLDRLGYADAIKKVVQAVGRPTKSEAGIEQRFLVASAEYPYPPERILMPGDPDANARKVQDVIPSGIPGMPGSRALTASGGLCAPLEPIYTMPNFAVDARPVRDSLPSFQAARGGVNVPVATYIGDITTAITVITEANDALGGTFATKSCQDLTCPDFTEVAVTIISHCREYGNLNARAWPEKIAHENDLTMAAHSRTAEQYLLDRIKALSLQVTQDEIGGAGAMSAYASLVSAITRAVSGVRYRLRMDPEYRFRALLPSWVPDLLQADNALMQFDRYETEEFLTNALEDDDITVAFYLDTPSSGVSQGFSAQSAGALQAFPLEVQYAIFPEGGFIHVDAGVLELGIVRDSTLNSTNDFQIFGESFENVARLAPQQATLWISQDICPTGVHSALGTAPTCAS